MIADLKEDQQSLSNQKSTISNPTATWPSGKARVCKTLITGSNPVVASKTKLR
jgi:hypothetical protein